MIDRSEAIKFRKQGLEQLGNLLLDENDAKLAMLTGMVLGENILLYGPPGGGKTTLGRDAYRLIKGVGLDDVATIPIESDLSPERLIGGKAVITTETEYNGEKVVETKSSDIAPIIDGNKKVIFANEINRINPYAINAGLEALEARVIDTSAGLVRLDGLEYVVSTMNPSDTRQGTFGMSAATASRHTIGADLGNNISDESLAKVNDDGWEPTPREIKPVIDLNELHTIREGVRDMHVADDVKPFSIGMVKGTVKGLAEVNIVEAKMRISKQLGKVAKTLALLGGLETVSQENVEKAAKFVVAARVGILIKRDAEAVTEKIVKEAVEQAW